MTDGIEEATHDVLTTLVQYELDESLALVDLEHRERVHLGWAVVEGDAVTQLLAGAALDNAVNRGEVRLRNLERRVHQAVSQVAVVGEEKQAFGVGVETADVEEPLTRLNALGDDVTDARTTEIVGHGALQPRGLFIAR